MFQPYTPVMNSPIKHIPRVPTITHSIVTPSKQNAYSRFSMPPALRQSAISSFQPYRPDPEVEKIISKYTASTITQPTSFQASTLRDNKENLQSLTFQRTSNQKNDDEIFEDFTRSYANQNYQQQTRKPSPRRNEDQLYHRQGNTLKPQDYKPQVTQPQKNDQVIMGAITAIIILLIFYILIILFWK